GPRSKRVVTSSIYPPRHAELEKAAIGPGSREIAIGSFGAAILWYLAILLVGAVAFPLAYAFFPRLPDRGAGVSRILGISGTTFFYALFVQARIFPNGGAAAWACLAVAAVPSGLLFFARRRSIADFFRARRKLAVGGEIAFALGFLLFLGIRSEEHTSELQSRG